MFRIRESRDTPVSHKPSTIAAARGSQDARRVHLAPQAARGRKGSYEGRVPSVGTQHRNRPKQRDTNDLVCRAEVECARGLHRTSSELSCPHNPNTTHVLSRNAVQEPHPIKHEPTVQVKTYPSSEAEPAPLGTKLTDPTLTKRSCACPTSKQGSSIAMPESLASKHTSQPCPLDNHARLAQQGLRRAQKTSKFESARQPCTTGTTGLAPCTEDEQIRYQPSENQPMACHGQARSMPGAGARQKGTTNRWHVTGKPVACLEQGLAKMGLPKRTDTSET